MRVNYKFDSVMRASKTEEADYLKELVVNGIISLNEARSMAGFEEIPDGDKHIVQLSYTTFDRVAKGENSK